MRGNRTRRRNDNATRRPAFTLAETLVATAIVAMLTAALGSLIYAATGAANQVSAVRQTQHHGRRCSDKLQELIRATHSGRRFPGAIVVTSTSGGQTFSDTLALWLPLGNPQAPDGRPRVREMLFIGPSPTDPSKLMQFRRAGDTALAPPWNDAAGWTALANSVCNDPAATSEVWTDLLHTASVGGATRGNVHFSYRAAPEHQEWQFYLNGSRTWNQLNWPIYGAGSQCGVRITNVRFELQLEPPTEQGATLGDFDRGVFFGAATIKTVLEK